MNVKFHSLQKKLIFQEKLQEECINHFLPHVKIENHKIFITNKSKILKMASDPVNNRKKRTKSVRMFKKARLLSKQSNGQTFLASSINLPSSVPLVSKFVKKQKQHSKVNNPQNRKNYFMDNQQVSSEVFDFRERQKKNKIVHQYSIKFQGKKKQQQSQTNSLSRLILEKQFFQDSQIQQNSRSQFNSSQDSILKELIKQIN